MITPVRATLSGSSVKRRMRMLQQEMLDASNTNSNPNSTHGGKAVRL